MSAQIGTLEHCHLAGTGRENLGKHSDTLLEAIVLLKETSVALIIGVSEFFTAIKGIVNTSYNVITPYLFAAIVYFITVYLISFGLKLLERRLQRSERN